MANLFEMALATGERADTAARRGIHVVHRVCDPARARRKLPQRPLLAAWALADRVFCHAALRDRQGRLPVPGPAGTWTLPAALQLDNPIAEPSDERPLVAHEQHAHAALGHRLEHNVPDLRLRDGVEHSRHLVRDKEAGLG